MKSTVNDLDINRQCEVEQEESSLALIEIVLSSEYKLENKASTSSSFLPLYISLLFTSLLLLLRL